MVNKKYFLTAGLLAAMAFTPAIAQESNQAQYQGRDMTYRGESYDVLDSAYIPKSRMEQHTQYLNHEYAFPAKPRNMWEIGIQAGASNIFGDVPSKGFWNSPKILDGLGFGLTIRKALGYSTSLRLQYNYLNASGFDYRGRDARVEQPWSNPQGNYNPGGSGGTIYSNYKFTGHELTLQLVGAINNIKFHKAKNSASLYGFIGAGALVWQTKVATGGDRGFDFDDLSNTADIKDRNTKYRDWLKDAEYDYLVTKENSTGAREDAGRLGDSDYYINPVLVGGLGVQFKLGDRVSLTIEDKITWTGIDYLDGVHMDPEFGAGLSPDKDILNYASIGLAFNLGSKSKNVLPLWWVNPVDHVYNELSDPRHMNLPAPILPDSDGDGVTDQFDKCPDTPAGVQVDTHGCPLDTDGDGVPDYLDKEKITPTECQPVDADGVGKCPDPECCKGITGGCNISAGTICFQSNGVKLTLKHQSELSNLAAQMKANPTCKVIITGNQGNSKLQQQRSWERVNAAIEYLTERENINRDQFIFQYQGTSGDVNCVMFRAAMPDEEGPSNVAPPHPQLGSK
ncbi:MAG TPA: hypothetical protein VK027_07415 [Chitinophagaceae bacterium]|nr:hypothetical protein [Chitinophagaceae bacterium]